MAASQNLCVDESTEEELWVSGGFGVPLSTAQHNSISDPCLNGRQAGLEVTGGGGEHVSHVP